MSSDRIALARQAHEASLRSEKEASRYRQQRDELIRSVRAEDPKKWKYATLAKAIGCSPELIAYIMKNTP